MKEDIIKLIKPEYIMKLSERLILEKVINNINKEIESISLFENKIKYARNYAEFMRLAFRWNKTPERFKWWFKKVFGKKFPICTDEKGVVIINHFAYTATILDEYIDKYGK